MRWFYQQLVNWKWLNSAILIIFNVISALIIFIKIKLVRYSANVSHAWRDALTFVLHNCIISIFVARLSNDAAFCANIFPTSYFPRVLSMSK